MHAATKEHWPKNDLLYRSMCLDQENSFNPYIEGVVETSTVKFIEMVTCPFLRL